jgi:hypothetical protein
MKRRVLWIEDSAYNEITQLSAPVYLSGRYDLRTALTASAAMAALADTIYDAIIVDIRILPGEDSWWIREYTHRGQSVKAARLGLRLLEVVLDGTAYPGLKVTLPGAAREPHRYGVLSVEASDSVADDLRRLKVTAYRNKTAAANARLLLDLLDEVAGRTPPQR